jgi:hypothetical protein
MILHVDDLLLTRDNIRKFEILEQNLTKQFEMINMGFMNLYIGLEFIYVMEGTLLIQWNYVWKILCKFNM